MTKPIPNTVCHSEPDLSGEESLSASIIPSEGTALPEPDSSGEESPDSFITSLLTDPLFLKIKSYGLIDEIALRNLIIKNEYRTLRSKLHLGDSVYQLSQKYFLSESCINTILFRKRNKKPISFPVIKF